MAAYCNLDGGIKKLADCKCSLPDGSIKKVNSIWTADGQGVKKIWGRPAPLPYAIAPAGEESKWDYTLDEAGGTVTLNFCKVNDASVAVYGSYEDNGKLYRTKLASNGSGKTNGYMFAGRGNIREIIFGPNIDTSGTGSMASMFYGCSSLSGIEFNGLQTGSVTNMDYMFYGCEALARLDLSGFDTRRVASMEKMFYNCRALAELDVSGFATGNVRNMKEMFRYCGTLASLDISGFDTGAVTDMGWMFDNCKALKALDIRGLRTGEVTHMEYMFRYCGALEELDVSGFDTGNVLAMEHMFEQCKALAELDLRSFNTGKVTNMTSMFSYCRNLKAVYVNKDIWTTEKAYTNGMFTGCGVYDVTYM